MQEEYYGIQHADGTYTLKQLYGWGTINANVWLPSLSELVGVTGTQNTGNGCYNSAMQGLNASGAYWTDAQGGAQFAYFAQSNVSGGGEKLWNACKSERTWTRSPDCGKANSPWQLYSPTAIWAAPYVCTQSYAVHPAGEHISRQILFIFFIHNAYFYRFIILFIAKNIHIYYNK